MTHGAVRTLMSLIWDLSYIYERCRSASTIRPTQTVRVKGESYLLDILRRQYPVLKFLSETYDNIKWVSDSVRDWIAYLDRKYADESRLLGPPIVIDLRDAEKLSQDAQTWSNRIIDEYAKQRTVFIREEAIDEILPSNMLSALDELTKNDLNDALMCILHLIPTPAAMICFRVAENIVRKYYTKLTNRSAARISWSGILKELEQDQQLKPSLLGYLHYLKDKRNEAEHPDKRFTQEESERIFLQIKGLLDEMGMTLFS